MLDSVPVCATAFGHFKFQKVRLCDHVGTTCRARLRAEGRGLMVAVHLQGIFVLFRKMIEPMNHRTGLRKVF